MLPQDYHMKARHLLRLAAERIQQEKKTNGKKSTPESTAATEQLSSTSTHREHCHLHASSDPGQTATERPLITS